MSLKINTLILSVSNLSDARYCAGMGVSHLCFDARPSSPSFTTAAKAKEISGWLEGVSIGVLVDTESNIEGYKKDFVVCDSIDMLAAYQEYPLFVLAKNDQLAHAALQNPQVEAIVVPADSSLSISMESLCEKTSVYWGKNLSASNIAQICETKGLAGICLEGGIEIKPGLKDFSELQDLLEAIEID